MSEKETPDLTVKCAKCGAPFDAGEAEYGPWTMPVPAGTSLCPDCRPDNDQENPS